MALRNLEKYISIYLKELSLLTISKLNLKLRSQDLEFKNMYIKGGKLIEDFVQSNLLLELFKQNKNMTSNDIDCYIEFESNSIDLFDEFNIQGYISRKQDIIKSLVEISIFESMYILHNGNSYVKMEIYYIIFLIKLFGFSVDESFLENITLADSKKIFCTDIMINNSGKYLVKVKINLFNNQRIFKYPFIDLVLGININDISLYNDYIHKYLPDKYNNIFTNNDKLHDNLNLTAFNLFDIYQSYNYRNFRLNYSSIYLYLLSLSYLSYKDIATSYFGQKYPGQIQYYKHLKSKNRLKTILDLFKDSNVEPYSRNDNKFAEFRYITSNLFKDEFQNQILNLDNHNQLLNRNVNLNYLFNIVQIRGGEWKIKEELDDNLVNNISDHIASLIKDKINKIKDGTEFNIIKYYSLNSGPFSVNLCKFFCTQNKKYLNFKIPSKFGNNVTIVKNEVYNSISNKIEPHLNEENEVTVQIFYELLINSFKILNNVQYYLRDDLKLPDEYFVFRGMNNQTYNSNMLQNPPKRLEDLVPGDIIKYDLCLSTSSKFNIAYNFTKNISKGFTIFRIKLHKEDRVIFMKNNDLTDFLNEYEILLPPGTELIVEEVKYYREWQMPNFTNLAQLRDPYLKDSTKYLIITCTFKAPNLNNINILDINPIFNIENKIDNKNNYKGNKLNKLNNRGNKLTKKKLNNRGNKLNKNNKGNRGELNDNKLNNRGNRGNKLNSRGKRLKKKTKKTKNTKYRNYRNNFY